MKTKSKMKAVIRDPRLAGESRPSRAKDRVAKHMQKSCTPVPTNTLKSMGLVAGGRNTSPCTSFQPLSSLASSRVDGSLYCAISLRSARSRIMAIMTVKKSTIMKELQMENQCTFSFGVFADR